MDRGLARIVSRQGGVLTREQALGSCTPAEVRARLRRGTWRRTPWRGVYVDGELPDDPRTVVRAAALWLGGDLVACHSTAALLWGFDLRSASAVAAGDLHFIAPDAVDNRRLERLWVHPSSLGIDDAVLRHGVWCTPPGRTACDVARLGAPVDALATLDAALHSRHCTPEDLHRARHRQRGLRGVARLDALLPHASARVQSPMESRMRWRFLDAGLPAPTVQVEVGGPGRRHRLDMGWEDHLLGAEFDGLEAHMTRRQLDGDRDRHDWLTERGWLLLHFTAVHVYRRHGEMVRMADRQLRARRPASMAP